MFSAPCETLTARCLISLRYHSRLQLCGRTDSHAPVCTALRSCVLHCQLRHSAGELSIARTVCLHRPIQPRQLPSQTLVSPCPHASAVSPTCTVRSPNSGQVAKHTCGCLAHICQIMLAYMFAPRAVCG